MISSRSVFLFKGYSFFPQRNPPQGVRGVVSGAGNGFLGADASGGGGRGTVEEAAVGPLGVFFWG